MAEWIRGLSGALPFGPEAQTRLLASLAVALGLWLAHRLVVRVVWRRTEDVRVRYRWRKTSAYVALALCVLLVAVIWGRAFRSLGTFLGLLTAGLAISLRELVTDLAGWVFLMWRKPFELGDRIQLGNLAGDVIDIHFFDFSLMEIGNWVAADQSTGRVVHVPNAKILSEPLANYTKGFQFIWNEIPVLITFESDWEKAKTILQEIVDKHALELSKEAEQKLRETARKYLIVYTTLTPVVYASVRDSGVLLTLRYLCAPRKRRGTTEAIWEDILRRFKEHEDIDFAYPTQRFYRLPESEEPEGVRENLPPQSSEGEGPPNAQASPPVDSPGDVPV